MEWGEAVRLTRDLAADPSSRVCASVGEWEHPVTWEALTVMSLIDLTHQIAWSQGGRKGPRPRPFPRPWPDGSRKVAKPELSQEEVLAALRYAGHTNLPTAAA